MMRNGLMIAGLAIFLAAGEARASITLKKVQVTDGNRVDLLFDQKVAPEQVRAEFFNDIVQITLSDASVYPAKINSVSGSELTKVFAYQYSPKVVRCRLTVKGKAEDFQSRIAIKPSGKILSIRLAAPTAADERDQITHSAAQVARVIPGSSGDRSPAANSGKPGSAETAEEQALLEKVLKAPPPSRAHPAQETGTREPKAVSSMGASDHPTKPLAGGKPLPSPLRSLAMLIAVVALFCGIMFAFRRFAKPSQQLAGHKGLSRLLSRIPGMGGVAGGKMIEVLATHYLGPKKSIAVVRIAGRRMVLGVSQDSINLIAQLPGDSAVNDADLESLALESDLAEPQASTAPAMRREPVMDRPGAPTPAPAPSSASGTGAVSAGPPVFADLLKSESAVPSVRDHIRSRIGGMKQL